MRRDQGIALVMVLFMTALISTLLITTNFSVKRQVETSTTLLVRSELELALRSSESDVLFALLTNRWAQDHLSLSENQIDQQKWSFSGIPFEVGGATVDIQDVSGLIAVPQREYDFPRFEMVLNEVIQDRAKVSEMMRRLKNRNAQYAGTGESPQMLPIQSTFELIGVLGLSDEEFKVLDELITVYPVTDFNPATAGDLALRARLGYPVGDEIIALRRQQLLDDYSFARLTDLLGNESIRFYPGPGFRIKLAAKAQKLRRSSQVIVGLFPYGTDPIIGWSRRFDNKS